MTMFERCSRGARLALWLQVLLVAGLVSGTFEVTPRLASAQLLEPEGDEDIAKSLFPKMEEREPLSISADFPTENAVWKAARDAAVELSGFDPKALDAVYGTVDGVPVTNGQVLGEAVMRFGEKFVEEYQIDLVIMAEIDAAGIEFSEEEVAAAEEDYWTQLRQQGVNNLDQLRSKFKWTPEFLRRKIYVNEGGKKVFAKDMGVDDTSDTEAFYMNIWLTKILERYPRTSSYAAGSEELGEGVLARIGDHDIRTVDVAPFLIPNLKAFHYTMAFESLAEKLAVERHLTEKGVLVSDSEVDARVDEERAKYAGSLFNWETMLQLSETNVMMERRKFRAWLAYRKLFGGPSEEALRAHYDANPVYFGRGAVAAAEIRTLAIDPVTGVLRGEDAWEKAYERILEAKAELDRGVAFQQIVMRYSEDPNTKKFEQATLFGGAKKRVAGSIGIFPIKEGRMSNELASAAFVCRKDEWIGPIEGRDGYHLIQIIDAKAPKDVPYDAEPYTDVNGNGAFDMGEPYLDDNENGTWNGGQRDNAVDDWMTQTAGAWVASIVEKADIERSQTESFLGAKSAPQDASADDAGDERR